MEPPTHRHLPMLVSRIFSFPEQRIILLTFVFIRSQYRSRSILPRLQLCPSYPSRRRAQVEASTSQGYDDLFRTIRLLHHGH